LTMLITSFFLMKKRPTCQTTIFLGNDVQLFYFREYVFWPEKTKLE
jgi:hypothetical protein